MKYLITICLLVMSLTSTAQTYSKELKESAKNGDVIAQRDMGICLYYGNGIKQDKKEAYLWLLRAELEKDAAAAYHLGVFHENDSKLLDRKMNNKIGKIIFNSNSPHADYLKSVVFGYEKEYVRYSYNAYIHFDKASYSYNNRDKDIALLFYEEAANENHINALLLLGGKYANSDPKKSFFYYKKAAESCGNTEAQYETGICYLKGWGVTKDIPKARFWLNKVAPNNPEAKTLLNELNEAERQDSIAQAQRKEEERLRLEEERRKQALLAKGTTLLPYEELREVKNYHFLGNSYSSETKLLEALCKNDVVSYAGMQNADNLDRAAYLQSNQYQIDKQKLEISREDVFVSRNSLSGFYPIYEADGFKVKLYYDDIINDFKNDYLYLDGFIVPTKSCTIGGFHYFKSKDIAALQKLKQSQQKGNAIFVLLCKPGFNVDNTEFPKYIVRPTALYITDKSTNEILMDLSQYLRTIDTKAEKQQIISQVKNDINKQEKYLEEFKKSSRKYLKEHFRAQCGSCGGLGYVKQFKGGVLTNVRCTTCYGRGYIDY